MARTRARKKHKQLTLADARKGLGRGGWRRCAGRKRKPGSISHDTRPQLRAQHPQHTTVRLVDGAPNLARAYLMKVIRKVIAQSHKRDFRIVEFNVLGNHLHLISEAAGAMELARGVQGFEVRLARRLNKVLKRSGKLFAARYHTRSLTTPTDVRNTLRYVLCNRQHHAAEKKFDKLWIDPFSSAPWFSGWAAPIRSQRDLASERKPTADATVWLLTTGWKIRHGPLRIDERPS